MAELNVIRVAFDHGFQRIACGHGQPCCESRIVKQFVALGVVRIRTEHLLLECFHDLKRVLFDLPLHLHDLKRFAAEFDAFLAFVGLHGSQAQGTTSVEETGLLLQDRLDQADRIVPVPQLQSAFRLQIELLQLVRQLILFHFVSGCQFCRFF